jgi:hypothetical protein
VYNAVVLIHDWGEIIIRSTDIVVYRTELFGDAQFGVGRWAIHPLHISQDGGTEFGMFICVFSIPIPDSFFFLRYGNDPTGIPKIKNVLTTRYNIRYRYPKGT